MPKREASENYDAIQKKNRTDEEIDGKYKFNITILKVFKIKSLKILSKDEEFVDLKKIILSLEIADNDLNNLNDGQRVRRKSVVPGELNFIHNELENFLKQKIVIGVYAGKLNQF